MMLFFCHFLIHFASSRPWRDWDSWLILGRHYILFVFKCFVFRIHVSILIPFPTQFLFLFLPFSTALLKSIRHFDNKHLQTIVWCWFGCDCFKPSSFKFESECATQTRIFMNNQMFYLSGMYVILMSVILYRI